MQLKALSGLKLIEFTHAVMGPSCGMILAELGAEVIFIEPKEGSPTRNLQGFGMGYFPYFGRSKKSLCLDLKDEEGLATAQQLIASADILIENFAPGTMERLGLGFDACQRVNSKLIYCSMKGFLSGPFQHRTALDEVVQMMGGLAYMTGPSGRPLRAGSSVVDITGGMFAVIGILAALRERDRTGEAQFIQSSLYETCAFLMGQHLACATLSKSPIPPMPERVSAWAVYQIFATLDEPVFIGIISDKHWGSFCQQFERHDLLERSDYRTNNLRIEARDQLLPELKNMLSSLPRSLIMERCERAGIPFAPIAKPEDLFEDPQLNLGGGLELVEFPDGQLGKLPRLPLEWNGQRLEVKSRAPKLGEHSREILRDWLGYSEEAIEQILQDKEQHL
ncbi:MAG: CoA transferase [Proteobacteria bacterium]|nr:CoA transferase [Pseudomonadota bacterium]